MPLWCIKGAVLSLCQGFHVALLLPGLGAECQSSAFASLDRVCCSGDEEAVFSTW